MSRRNKLEKFAELLTFPNVYQNYHYKNPRLQGTHGQEVDLKGRWCSEHFKNDAPLVVELACGGGEYTLALAEQYPMKNFVGVDIKGNRIWKGARKALEADLRNVAFLRTRIEQLMHFFAPDEIDEIWITFPDPFLRKSKANRRLTSPHFLDTYWTLLKKDGEVHLKTDSPELFAFTLDSLQEHRSCEVICADHDIYSKTLTQPELAIQTFYEKMHLAEGKTIKHIQFRFRS
ncbi:MAG: tRNA (guanosine(46)-N7)-methyltransferase TrmB [Saprospiraceae bacterium]|nr:tRNA (guanosine(46)-N7)-methyltransferase TrmB [Saprospiraceae bacterium]